MMVRRTFGPGIDKDEHTTDEAKVIQYIYLKLAALGYNSYSEGDISSFLEIAQPLLNNYKEKARLLSSHLSPIGSRIQGYFDALFQDIPDTDHLTLPEHPFLLDHHGLARIMSLPSDADSYETDIVKSYRTTQGILHNPKEDRRTTKGVFHVCEGGLPIPNDKKAVPKITFARLLDQALDPPKDLLTLPFTANQEEKAQLFVGLLLRPIVVPEVQGVIKEKSMEIRFFAPGSLVSNLDFVESIFGNAGDPHLPENDAALDAESWTGHTGCVFLAPHLINCRKKDLGLPHYDDASERQRRDDMCWRDESEKYNDGRAFKITSRDEKGVIVTIIADNYFGYCKKEVKTQISYSANLFGLCEEEHAGGAIAFPSYDLGEEFQSDEAWDESGLTFKDILHQYRDLMDLQVEEYGIDKKFPDVIYVPQNAHFKLIGQTIRWETDGWERTIKLLPYKHYVLPSGFKVEMKKHITGSTWRLIGTMAEGTLCHKPCTVSGGGKSEISKSIQDAMIQGPVIVADIRQDFDAVDEIMKKDFSTRWSRPFADPRPTRPILSPERSLGSVIKLFTPADDYSDAYNAWLASIPQRVKDLIYIIKRHYDQDWADNWRDYFSVDRINGTPGNELKFNNRKLQSFYLRVGRDIDQSWRIFQLRKDYAASQKVQFEDDITASVVLDAKRLSNLNPDYTNPSVKLVKNCEVRLFQRPDDCIHKGYDRQAEQDLSSPNSFISNFEPLTRKEVIAIQQDIIGFEDYTLPVQELILNYLRNEEPKYLVVPSEPRLVKGVPSKNPRYLQTRPDLANPIEKYMAKIRSRLHRRIPIQDPLFLPVNAVLPGRRNNPADKKSNVPPLAVYGPIHYQELPELFIDFIASITGKSPSTTGFGSEGALTKGPFNALLPASDLNNAFLSYILTNYAGFSSAAGYVGPKYRVDHDISLLIPEIWCRMSVKERDPKYLIENEYLEKVEDFEYKGRRINASLLGYRISRKFVHHFLGRIFSNPDAVLTEDMLAPELQDMEMFVASIDNLSITQKRVAEGYLLDGTYEALCPPLQALIQIMIHGHFEGKDRHHADIRSLFTRDSVLQSQWYKERLYIKQQRDIDLWTKNISYLEGFLQKKNFAGAASRLDVPGRLQGARRHLQEVSATIYLDQLQGTFGADPLRAVSTPLETAAPIQAK
ncbi:MAG: hypothetical protein OEQ53_04010 [Saprospiraceae bacterium]|nr:hypothetical protein [Saprospiraceae bacterium]